MPGTGEPGFAIVASEAGGEPEALVSPDMATCDECLAELFDPADRRHRYPFINCTNCGPRFTIVRGVPYDRALTTMAGFEMCATCRAEYEDPADRRFHAQPNACPDCGPEARLVGANVREGEDARRGRRRACCSPARCSRSRGSAATTSRATPPSESAVAALRSRKHREDKPFALMAPSLDAARDLVELTPGEESAPDRAAAPDRDRPRPRRGGRCRRASPHARRDLGVMLPYTPAPPPAPRRCGHDAGDDLRATSPTSRSPSPMRTQPGGWATSPTRSSSTTARSTCAPTTRSSAPLDTAVGQSPLLMRRARGYVPRRVPLPPGPLNAPSWHGRRAQEHVLRRQGLPGLGEPPHRRPQELGDAGVVPRGRRALRAAVRGRARRGRPRPAPGLPVDPVRAGAGGRGAGGGPAPPRPSCGMPRRARRGGPGGRRDLRRDRPRPR